MIEPVFSPFPDLTTSRLWLRAVEITDAPEIFFLRSSLAVMRYIDRPRAANVGEAEEFIRKASESMAANENVLWGIALKNIKPLVGYIGFWRMEKENHRAEIGYALHPDYYRRGIMFEALQAAIEYGFKSMGLHTIEANINPGNEASRQLLLKSGFQKEAYFRENYYIGGKFLDSEIYGLVNE